jgi:hypothetical protein
MYIVSEGSDRRSGRKKISDGADVAVGVGEGVGVSVGDGEGVSVGSGVGVAVGKDVAVGEGVSVGWDVAVGSAGEAVGVTSSKPVVQPNNASTVTNNTNRSILTIESCITTASYTLPHPPWLLRTGRQQAGAGGGWMTLTGYPVKQFELR